MGGREKHEGLDAGKEDGGDAHCCCWARRGLTTEGRDRPELLGWKARTEQRQSREDAPRAKEKELEG